MTDDERQKDDESPNLLWFQPSTGDHISVRRDRIAEQLETRGYDTTIVDASGLDALGALSEAVFGDHDILFGNVRIGLYLGYPVARALGLRFVGDVSDPIEQISDLPAPVYRFLYWYEHFVLAHADANVFTYRSSQETASERGIDGVHLPNAVDYERFVAPPQEVVDDARAELDRSGVDFEKPMAVYIGGLGAHYHIAELLSAAEQCEDWAFLFLGEGELEAEVRQAADRLPNVHFPGAVPYNEVPGYLAHATVGFCLLDRRQNLKIAEYGAAGLVGVVEHGALTDRFPDEVIGIDPTPEEIVETLDSLAADPELCETYGDSLHERASEYDWAAIADGYEEIIQRLTNER